MYNLDSIFNCVRENQTIKLEQKEISVPAQVVTHLLPGKTAISPKIDLRVIASNKLAHQLCGISRV
jgi:hypothetical protein